MTSTEQIQNKTWELSLYELHRSPQIAVIDNTEIAVSPRSLHSELMCPICLDMLKKTMTTKECLHRFCSDCIITALRSGNKECPTCRKKLVSKRSLRPDPNFDLLIAKIYPSRDEYEAHQERVLAKLNKSQSQTALVNSIKEGIQLQSQNRPQRSRKNLEDSSSNTNTNTNTQTPMDTTTTPTTTKDSNQLNQANQTLNQLNQMNQNSSNPASLRNTPSPAPSNVSSTSKQTHLQQKRPKSVLTSEKSESESSLEGNDSNLDTEAESLQGDQQLQQSVNEIELVFKPHPIEMAADNQLMKALKENSIRYIKTTANATVDHLSKYLAMRLTLDLDSELPDSYRTLNFCIYIAPSQVNQANQTVNQANQALSQASQGVSQVSQGQLLVLSGNQTLRQVNDRFWKVNKPLEMFYSWKKT